MPNVVPAPSCFPVPLRVAAQKAHVTTVALADALRGLASTTGKGRHPSSR